VKNNLFSRGNDLQKGLLKWTQKANNKIIKLEGYFFKGIIIGNVAKLTFLSMQSNFVAFLKVKIIH